MHVCVGGTLKCVCVCVGGGGFNAGVGGLGVCQKEITTTCGLRLNRCSNTCTETWKPHGRASFPVVLRWIILGYNVYIQVLYSLHAGP